MPCNALLPFTQKPKAKARNPQAIWPFPQKLSTAKPKRTPTIRPQSTNTKKPRPSCVFAVLALCCSRNPCASICGQPFSGHQAANIQPSASHPHSLPPMASKNLKIIEVPTSTTCVSCSTHGPHNFKATTRKTIHCPGPGPCHGGSDHHRDGRRRRIPACIMHKH